MNESAGANAELDDDDDDDDEGDRPRPAIDVGGGDKGVLLFVLLSDAHSWF